MTLGNRSHLPTSFLQTTMFTAEPTNRPKRKSKNVTFNYQVIHDWQYGKTSNQNERANKECKENKKSSNLNKTGGLAQKPSSPTLRGTLDIELKLPEIGFAYGVPNRPSTPVKHVISNSLIYQTTLTEMLPSKKHSKYTNPCLLTRIPERPKRKGLSLS